MPFKSQAQRRFMYSQHPKIAKRWEKETPKGKLPDKKEGTETEAFAPSMNSVFEAKRKAKKYGGPGEPTKVDCRPGHLDNPLDDLETAHDEECLDDIYKMGMGEGIARMVPGLVEALNPGQLHDPKDFVQKLRELAAETASNCAALDQFVEAHKGDPEWNGVDVDELTATLGEMSESASKLAKSVGPVEQALTQKEQREDMAAQRGGGPSSGGALFSKK